jgi:hypothetical protein
MGKGILAQLLEALEKTPPLSKHPILAEIVHASREPIEGQWKYPFHLVRYAAIDIIKSGIFIGDRLKGKKIPSSPPKFQTYPIKDPEELVWLIALPLARDIGGDVSRGMYNFAHKEIKRCFSEIIKNLDHLVEILGTWGKPIRMDVREGDFLKHDFYQTEVKGYLSEFVKNMNPLPGVIEIWGSPKTKDKIDNIKEGLESLKEELLINVPGDSFRLEDPIDYMVNVLQRHVPDAPGETIAKRVADILKTTKVGVVRYQTVLQRMTRRKQRKT